MHEFSLAGEVIRLTESEADRNDAISVSEITIEVGDFSGVQVEAFRSAIEILTEKSRLRKTSLNIIRKKGRGICQGCKQEFEMEQRIDTCPLCGAFPSEISGGYEFRVVSLVVEKD
jgi:hydrogenase nickel incorporation protein HypA/HybF